MENFLDYALEYVSYGLAVFPLRPKSKEPLTKNGCKDATTDELQVKEWWTKYPNANIAIATGQVSNGVCVVDMDLDEEKGKNGLRALDDWWQTYGAFGDSWMSKTGRGGYHYFFHINETVRNRVDIISGVDVRGDGGYIVAPPSLHPNGNRYEWVSSRKPSNKELIEANDTIKYFLSIGNVPQQTSKYLAPAKIPEGQRNDTLFRLACSLQGKGLSDEAIFAAVFKENETKCNPMVPEDELRKTISSALKFDKGKPIYVKQGMIAEQGVREPIFKLTDKGHIKKTTENIVEAIEYDEKLYGCIKFNELANSIWVYGQLPWKGDTYRSWSNTDDANLKNYLEARYGFNSSEKIMDALDIVSHKYAFNPIKDALIDNYRERGSCSGSIRKLLPEYLGVEDTDYQYEVMKVYMLGAISRIFNPGCKFDYTLIIYGTQGFGKSEFLRHLAINSDWFNDNFNTFDGDKAIEKLNGMWIVEMAELKALKSAKDSESFKSFLTSRVDTYRAPYARRTTQRPRMCVFAGTTNNKNVFVDKTGNRRFLPIESRTGKQTKNLFGDQEKVMNDFYNAWAEAMDLYEDAGHEPSLILPKEVQSIAESMQEEFSEEDYRVGMIQNWLDNTNASKTCVPQIIEYALGLEIEKVPAHRKREVMDIMDNEIKGWSRMKNDNKGRIRFGKYGRQIAFIKDIEL